jgi:SAM-dependent methyltransferase
MTAERHLEDQAGGTCGSAEAAMGWRRSSAARAQLLAPLTERMLDLAQVGVGHRVLDVAAGTGEQTLAAARRVGPTGAVVATDIAAQMLALAAEAAAEEGLRNVETCVVDARALDLEPESFDAAISRLALMLIPERARALEGIHRALKPGKKFAALVLATADESPLIALPMAIAARHAGAPQAPFDDPGLFALGDPVCSRLPTGTPGFPRSPSSRRYSSGGCRRSRWRCKPSGICFQRFLSCWRAPPTPNVRRPGPRSRARYGNSRAPTKS